MISPSQRPLPDNTKHSQQTNIHAPRGIRTHDRSRRAAVHLRLRPCGYWDRLRYCIIIIFFSTFMQGTYNYTCKTRHVPRVYNGAAFLWLQFIVDVMLFTTTNVLCFYISTLRVMWAVLSMVVFCCSLTSCFPGMLPRYVCIYVCMYYYYYLLRLA